MKFWRTLYSLIALKFVKREKTIHPEEAPTCEGCGGQIEHPDYLFTFPPENGLCAMELQACFETEASELQKKISKDRANIKGLGEKA